MWVKEKIFKTSISLSFNFFQQNKNVFKNAAKTYVCRYNCSVQWQRKQKLAARLEQKLLQLKVNKKHRGHFAKQAKLLAILQLLYNYDTYRYNFFCFINRFLCGKVIFIDKRHYQFCFFLIIHRHWIQYLQRKIRPSFSRYQSI